MHWSLIILNNIGALILSVMGIISMHLKIQQMKICLQSRRWPHTDGVVESFRLERVDDADGVTYRRRAMYRYTVDNTPYRSDQISFIDIQYGWRSAQRSWRGGDVVPVYYNPENPQQAVLEPGMRGVGKITSVIAPLVFLVGGIVLGAIVTSSFVTSR